MALNKVNALNTRINRITFGDHVEPPSSEQHIDITRNMIGVNVYYDESQDKWLSCNSVANYAIKFTNNKLVISWADGYSYGTEVNFTDRISINYDGLVQLVGTKDTIVNYGSDSNLFVEHSGYTMTNLGASGQIYLTLPETNSTTIGLNYRFHVRAGYVFSVKPYSGDTIRDLTSTTTIEIRSTQLGASIRLVCVASGQWETEAEHGTWATL